MMKRAAYFVQKCVTKFKKNPAIQKQWLVPASHHKNCNKDIDSYDQLGGQRNPCVSANAVTELQHTIDTAMATNMATLRNESVQTMNAREERVND